jgi:chaperonin GroES
MATEFLKLSRHITIDKEVMKAANLTDRFNDDDLTAIGGLVYEGYQADEASRSDWLRRNEAGMDFAMQVVKDKNWPWQGCSNVIFPLITIAALQFSSRAYSNIVSGTDIVKCRVPGEDPSGALTARSVRISKHMSWQVLEQDASWEEQHDRLLINDCIVGTAFIKAYFDGKKAHNTSDLVLAKDLILNYYAKSVDDCQRKTHRLPPMSRNDIYERVKRGMFRDVLEASWYQASVPPATTPASAVSAQVMKDNRQGVQPPPPDRDTPFQFLEQHRNLDLDGDGYAEPYIVTIEETSRAVVRIVARWDNEAQVERTIDKDIICINATEYFVKYGFIPSPDGGIYDIGFGVLLGPLNESVNTAINQLFDAGTMQNSLGGFLGRGAKIRGGQYSMAPWEWVRVDSTGDDLRKNIVPFPDRQPSAVLFNLLSLLIDYTNRVASVADQMVGKTPGQNTPAETSRNALEQGMQVFTTIFRRTWRSMKEEFKKLFKLNAIYLPQNFTFGEGQGARKEDYLSPADAIVPAADPNVASFQLKFFKAQAIRDASRQVHGYDIDYVEREFLRAMGVEAVDRYFPGRDKVPPPVDPKMAIAEMQMKIKKLQIEESRLQWVATLMEQKRINSAKIVELQAKAAATVAGIDEAQAATQLSYLQMALDTLQAQNQAINERIAALAQVGGEGEDAGEGQSETGGNANGSPGTMGLPGGIPAMEGGPGDEGTIPADEALAEEPAGAME